MLQWRRRREARGRIVIVMAGEIFRERRNSFQSSQDHARDDREAEAARGEEKQMGHIPEWFRDWRGLKWARKFRAMVRSMVWECTGIGAYVRYVWSCKGAG